MGMRSLEQDAVHRARECMLFVDFTDEQFQSIMDRMQVIQLQEGEFLFRQGQSASHFFQLLRGQVALTRISNAGREKVIDLVTPPQTFAEAVMFLKTKIYPVNGQAIEPCITLRFDSQAYLKILRESVDACVTLLGKMSQRLHWQVREIDRLTLHDATSRVVAYLLEQVPADTENPTEVRLHAPKHVIASRVSIKPETLSRILARLKFNNLIHVEDSHITLTDITKIRRYTEGGIA